MSVNQTSSTTQRGGTDRTVPGKSIKGWRHKHTQLYNKEAEQDGFDRPVSHRISVRRLQRHAWTSCSGQASVWLPQWWMPAMQWVFCLSVGVLQANISNIKRCAKIIPSPAGLITSAGAQVFPTMHCSFIKHVAKVNRFKKITTTQHNTN